MARIANVNIPVNKRVPIGLRYIHGIGYPSALKICQDTGISVNKRIKDLSDQELTILRNIIEKEYEVEGELRRKVKLNIKREKNMKSYRGLRHIKNLPVRGQNTHSNANTKKGRARPIPGKTKSNK